MNRNGSRLTTFLWALLSFIIGTVLVPFVSLLRATGGEQYNVLRVGRVLEDESGDEANPVLEYAIVVGIVLLLIMLTILFEYSKDYMLESASRTTRPIVESLFGELTVLGFLSIFTFVVTKAGWVMRLGESLFGENREDELLEVFESVHYTIFVIMVFFVLQVLALVGQANATANLWLQRERMARNPDVDWSRRAVDFKVASTYMTILRWIRSYSSIIPRFNERTSTSPEQQHFLLLYKALREEFVLDRDLDYPFTPSSERVEEDFNFARYLAACQASFLTKVVDVEISTWVFFVVAVVVYYLFVLAVHCNETVLAWTWVAFAWSLFLFTVFFERHLFQVLTAFASKEIYRLAHRDEQPPTAESIESTGLLESDGASDHLLPDWCRVDVEQYMRNRPYLTRCFAGGVPNRQQALYWMDRKGPPLYLFIIQFGLLFIGIFCSIQFIQLGPYMYNEQPNWAFLLYLILASIPVLNAFVNKRRLVAVLTMVCNLGFYRRPQVIANVIREEKTAQAVRTIIIIYKLRRFAVQAKPAKKHSHIHYSHVFDKHELEEIGRTFDEFDVDGSGSITTDEFEKLMSRLGADMSHEELLNMVSSLDTDKSGGVDRDEFIQWYADHSRDDHVSEREFGKFMFHLFGQNGREELTVGEFVKKLQEISTRYNVDEVGALVNELDNNDSGTICEEDFRHLFRKYYPRELGSHHHFHKYYPRELGSHHH